MKIGFVQYNPVWENKEENKIKLYSLLQDQRNSKIDLVVFPEMTLTGFTMRAEKYAEPLEGNTYKYFSEIARKYNSDIMYGVIEEANSIYFNTLVHINSQGMFVNKYRKIHPFSYSSEDKHYTKGELPIITDINGWKAGLSICYDLRFPELYRFYGKSKTELIIVAANWPDTRIEHWKILLKARAIENQCFVIGVNRVGNDPKLFYPGSSMAVNPMGKEIVSSTDEEKIFLCEINKREIEEVRNKLPFLNDITMI